MTTAETSTAGASGLAAAPSVTFYDCQADQRLQRITRLVGAAWERGRRLLIHCADQAEAASLDSLLWTFEPGSFIPHEVVPPGASLGDADAKVVIVAGPYDPIGADVLLQASPVEMAFCQRYPFVIDIVDHRTPELLAASRARFKAWSATGQRPAFRPGATPGR